MSLYIVDIHGELEGDYEIIKKYEEPTTKNNCAEQNGCITCSLDDGDDCCRKLYEESMQELTTKNDLGVDCVSRQAISGYIDYILSHGMGKKKSFGFIKKFVDKLPSVTPQEQQSFKWCTDCREYDQEKHCCHRWSKAIRNTVEEMKQEYIEREVLDKIRAEIDKAWRTMPKNRYEEGLKDQALKDMQIIDRYTAESEK